MSLIHIKEKLKLAVESCVTRAELMKDTPAKPRQE